MSDHKQEYIEKKQAILDCLSDSEQFLVENNYEAEANVVKDAIAQFEKGEFSISVVGEFSAGKSTFLNALMGEKILPSFTNETTATVNFLRHKEKSPNGEGGIVYYNDGHEQSIPNADFENITRYVSTSSDEVDVAKSVDHLDLFLESRFLEGNVTLVDTPGLNGMAEGHREITQHQIERSSAGIFLFNANQPGSRSDFEFLSELRKRVDGKSIILVLNKIDSIKANEGETVESVIKKLKENYKQVYPDVTSVPEIWPVSAYNALVARCSQELEKRDDGTSLSETDKQKREELSHMKDFEDRLWRFLTHGEKAKQEMLAPINQLNSQLTDLIRNCKVKIDMLSGAVDQQDIEAQKLELEKSIDGLKDTLGAAAKDMEKDVHEAENDFYDEIKAETERFKNRFTSMVENFQDLDEIDPENIKANIERSLRSIAADAYENYSSDIRGIMARSAADITENLNDSLSSELNIKIDGELELRPIKTGIEEFEKESQRIKQEISKLSEDIKTAEDDLIKAMELEQQRDMLEQKLNENQKKIDVLNDNGLMYAPEVKRWQKEEWVKKGGVAGFFGGMRRVITDVVDDTERREYIAERDRILKNHENKIHDIEEQLRNIPKADVRTREKSIDRKNALLNERRAELSTYQTQYAEKIRGRTEAALRRQKREIERYIDDASHEFIKQSKKDFTAKRASHLEIMRDLVGGSISDKLKLKQRELEQLEQNMKTAVTERDAELKKYSEQHEKMQTLIDRSMDLYSEIDAIQPDEIKEERI